MKQQEERVLGWVSETPFQSLALRIPAMPPRIPRSEGDPQIPRSEGDPQILPVPPSGQEYQGLHEKL